jgi:phenylalanyl-tRNA synthetase alpha subunit
MEEFFGRTGNTKLRFKPAYNPYTEVSGERDVAEPRGYLLPPECTPC